MTKADTSAAAVERLIAVTNGIPAFAPHNATLRALLARAERAEAERKRLREALREISANEDKHNMWWAARIARAALGEDRA